MVVALRRFVRMIVRSRCASVAGLAAIAAVLAVFLGTGVAEAGAKSKGTGRLEVRVSGLPKGQRPAAVLRGPGGLKRSVPAGGLSLAAARVGRYRLALVSVTIARTSGPVKKGAVAKPSRKSVSVRVSAAKRVTLQGTYGSIINPGIKAFRGRVVSVAGSPGDPITVVLPGRVRFAKDAILSIAPGGVLPRGLLSRVVGVKYGGGNTTVSVRAASIYDVAPVFEFDVPLALSPQVVSRIASCSGISGLSPYRTIRTFRSRADGTRCDSCAETSRSAYALRSISPRRRA